MKTEYQESDSYKRIQAQNTFKQGIEVPALELPQGWKIRLVYPFMLAYVRCHIITPHSEYSVYYDVDGSLGAVNEPYWEILLDDCYRFLNGQEEELIKCIEQYEKKEFLCNQ